MFASRILLLCTDSLCSLISKSIINRIHREGRKIKIHPEALARDFPVTVCLSSDQNHSILFAPNFDNFENLFFEISFFDFILSGTDSSGENVVTVDLRFRALFSRFSLLISLFCDAFL